MLITDMGFFIFYAVFSQYTIQKMANLTVNGIDGFKICADCM